MKSVRFPLLVKMNYWMDDELRPAVKGRVVDYFSVTITILLLLCSCVPINSYGGSFGAGGLKPSSKNEPRCEPIEKVAMCRGIGYNLTKLPNQFNHDTQEEAGMEVHQYYPLVQIQCSSDLKFFICSLYIPICIENYEHSVPPCRSVCERARAGCEPVMIKYGFPWPEKMQCDRFPNYGKGSVCMDEKNGEMPKKVITTKRPSKVVVSRPNDKTCRCECRAPLIKLEAGKRSWWNVSAPLRNGIETGNVENCALPCHGGYGSPEEKHFSSWWLSLWSGLCCFTTFITLLTFIIDPNRLKYPERPIVYLSSCYFMVSVGYLLRLWKGHEAIACKGDIVKYGLETGPTSAWCTVVFLLIYYFSMASSIWWVVLSLSWFLASGLKWGSEAIASSAHLFHIAAWVIPALATVSAITDGAVDGDAISGICSVGNQDPMRLIIYNVVPLAILLVLGTSFLLAGIISLFRIRRVVARQDGPAKTEKLEKLMIRIGVFSVLYTVPATTVLGTYFYEMSKKQEWLEGITCSCRPPIEKPQYAVLMLKYFMSLAVGITSGVWIWSGKTIESWQRFLSRLCGSRSGPKPQKFANTAYQHPNQVGKNLTHV